jgi:rubrerythrin
MTSRASFLGYTSATALVGVSLLGELVSAAANIDPNDLTTLNAAIELESGGIKAYEDAAATKLLSPPVLKVALGFRADHVAHREALVATVRATGNKPSDKIAPFPPPALASEADVLAFAMFVEEKAASTYLSVISDFVDRNLAQVAAAILGIETTHVARLAEVLKTPLPYTHAFVT